MRHEQKVDAMMAEWRALDARLRAVDASIMERARAAAAAAGLDPSMPLQWHNALVSAEYGQPWREVDYSLARRARWLSEHERSRVHRLRDRLWTRCYTRHLGNAT